MLEFAEWLAGTDLDLQIAVSGRGLPTSRIVQRATGAGGATPCI
jgi:hypothetical protein